MDEVGESLWPAVAAVLAFLVINIVVRLTIPAEGVFRAPWLTPALEVLVLIVLVTHRPTSAAERRRLRRLAGRSRAHGSRCRSTSRSRSS